MYCKWFVILDVHCVCSSIIINMYVYMHTTHIQQAPSQCISWRSFISCKIRAPPLSNIQTGELHATLLYYYINLITCVLCVSVRTCHEKSPRGQLDLSGWIRHGNGYGTVEYMYVCTYTVHVSGYMVFKLVTYKLNGYNILLGEMRWNLSITDTFGTT